MRNSISFMGYLNAYLPKFGITPKTQPAVEKAYESLTCQRWRGTFAGFPDVSWRFADARGLWFYRELLCPPWDGIHTPLSR
jgi:hypothetical protein